MEKDITKQMTIGEEYSPAMEIQTQEEADEYFEFLVQHAMYRNKSLSREAAENNMRSNLGYYAGYYDDKTRERVERLFHCAHPILGAINTSIFEK